MNSLAINLLIFLNIINPEWFRCSAVQRLVGLLGGGGGGGGGGVGGEGGVLITLDGKWNSRFTFLGW